MPFDETVTMSEAHNCIDMLHLSVTSYESISHRVKLDFHMPGHAERAKFCGQMGTSTAANESTTKGNYELTFDGSMITDVKYTFHKGGFDFKGQPRKMELVVGHIKSFLNASVIEQADRQSLNQAEQSHRVHRTGSSEDTRPCIALSESKK